MPWLYFEDWHQFIGMVTPLNLPLGDTVIKVFAVPKDPRGLFNNAALAVVEMDGSPFDPMATYHFEDRQSFAGEQLERYLDDLPPIVRENARALFRFSHVHGFMNNAMKLKNDTGFTVAHPMQVIDGWKYAHKWPLMLHLDIFLKDSLATLKGIVNYDDMTLLQSAPRGNTWRQTQRY